MDDLRHAAIDAGELRRLGWTPRVGEVVGGITGALRNPAQGYGSACAVVAQAG